MPILQTQNIRSNRRAPSVRILSSSLTFLVLKPLVFLLACTLFIFLNGCGGAGNRIAVETEEPVKQAASPLDVPSSQQIPEKTVVPSQPLEIVDIVAVKRKKIVEFVEIEGKRYQVPPLWRGRKITEKAADVAELRQIPIKYTWQETKLYIHDKACNAFVAMAAKAEEDGVRLQAHSGFRSIHYQKKIFSKGMAKGRSWEDMVRYVAPPGYSEHMLGTVVDLYPSDWRFAATAAYEWLREHAAAYGFVESYPKINSEGLPWEAWHWRYIDQP